MNFRQQLTQADLPLLRAMVVGTGFFSTEEVAIALELAEANLKEGEASGYQFLVLAEDTRLVGYTCFGRIPATQSAFDLYWIVVAQDAQGRGFGRQLLQVTEEIIQKCAGNQVFIETSSRAQYVPTQSFYLKSGYQQVAFFEDFYGPGDGKLVYRKRL